MIYRKYNSRDLVEIKKLTDNLIGYDFYSLQYLNSILTNDNHIIFVCQNEKNDVCGYYYSMVISKDDLMEILHLNEDSIESVMQYIPQDEDVSIGILKTGALISECRGGKIAHNLMDMMMRWFNEKKVYCVFCEAVIKPDGKMNAKKLMDCFKFRPLVRVVSPWRDIDFYCPFCHKNHCECDAMLFAKKISGD